MNKMNSRSRPELFDFHGVSMTHYCTENWENIENFQARPDDIAIASYPKAGNTWLVYIVDLLFGQMSSQHQTTMQFFQRAPNLEITYPSLKPGGAPRVYRGTEMADKLITSPRIIRTHLPVQFLPKSFWEQNCKIVYVARNPKDSVVSYFHFDRMTLIQPEPGDWSSYVQRFMKGKMAWGSWYDHVNNWWKKKQTYANIHFMFYEDMNEDTGREIDKLCSFLGLSPSAEEKKSILEKGQFDKMKVNNMVNLTTFPEMDFKASSFIRKGKVGDWKNHFTVAQNEEFDEDYKKKMETSRLEFRTTLHNTYFSK